MQKCHTTPGNTLHLDCVEHMLEVHALRNLDLSHLVQDVQERFEEDPAYTRSISVESNMIKHKMKVIMHMKICLAIIMSVKIAREKRKSKEKNKMDESRYSTPSQRG